jgi:hypothetical protein
LSRRLLPNFNEAYASDTGNKRDETKGRKRKNTNIPVADRPYSDAF